MRKQSGLTIMQLMVSALLVVMLGILAIRVTPIYIEYFAIKRTVTALNTISQDKTSSQASENVEMMRQRLLRQFEMDGFSLQHKTINIVAVEGKANVYQIHVVYQSTVPLFFNISLLFTFDDMQEVTLGNAQGGN